MSPSATTFYLFIYLLITRSIHIQCQLSTYFCWVFVMPNNEVSSFQLTSGVIFLPPKSACGLKSNLSDFSYDGLKQVSVFKTLKVISEKRSLCTDPNLLSHLCRSLSAPSSIKWLWWLSNKDSELVHENVLPWSCPCTSLSWLMDHFTTGDHACIITLENVPLWVKFISTNRAIVNLFHD